MEMAAWHNNFQVPESSVTHNGCSSNSRRFTNSQNSFRWRFSDCRNRPPWRSLAYGLHSRLCPRIFRPAVWRVSAQTATAAYISRNSPADRSATRARIGKDSMEHFDVFASECERSGKSRPRDNRWKSRTLNKTTIGLPRRTGLRPSASHRSSDTGALRDRAGRFELADGGTLFLDEVGEIPLDMQAKLLRVLQAGEIERIGEERTRKIDVRIIAATNRNLRAESEAGRSRQDLFYRLSVFPMELPPLRKRVEDIPLLADHFLIRFARQLGRPRSRLTLAIVQELQRNYWPGNFRELRHTIERARIVAADGRLRFDLPATIAMPR